MYIDRGILVFDLQSKLFLKSKFLTLFVLRFKKKIICHNNCRMNQNNGIIITYLHFQIVNKKKIKFALYRCNAVKTAN